MSHRRSLELSLPCAFICMQSHDMHSYLLCRAALYESVEGSALCRCIEEDMQHTAVAVAC